jgi:hypothetical protein
LRQRFFFTQCEKISREKKSFEAFFNYYYLLSKKESDSN